MPKKKKMPAPTYEIYDGLTCDSSTYVTTYTGEDAFCNALKHTRDNLPSMQWITYSPQTNTNWVGGRPGKP